MDAWYSWATKYAGEEHAAGDQREGLSTMAGTTGEVDARWCVAFGWEAYGGSAGGKARLPATPLGDASPITDRGSSPGREESAEGEGTEAEEEGGRDAEGSGGAG